MTQATGFVVIYQWRVKDGLEAQFVAAWEELTETLKRQRGARGSRLHRTDYGSLMAYAQWPDRQSWERACAAHEEDQLLSQRILDTVEETWPPIFLTPLRDTMLTEAEVALPHVTH